jgi:hypothetical protein
MHRVWADAGYAGKLIEWVLSFCQRVLEIVKRNEDVKGFKLLPKRWVVERTFSWLSNYRRLSKRYEDWNETAEAMIHPAMIHVMRQRLAHALEHDNEALPLGLEELSGRERARKLWSCESLWTAHNRVSRQSAFGHYQRPVRQINLRLGHPTLCGHRHPCFGSRHERRGTKQN